MILEVDTYRKVSRYDPTHTTLLRNAFVREVKKRFAELKRVIKVAVVNRDCFGIGEMVTHQVTPPGWRAFAFSRSEQKISEFIKWLDKQIEDGVLTVGDLEQAVRLGDSLWMNRYVLDTYKRGLLRAKLELRRAGYNVPDEEWELIKSRLMFSPVHLNTLVLLYTRVFSGLKGITAQMDSLISQVLAQGLADGDGPALLARKLIAVIDGSGLGTLGIKDSLGRFIPPERRAIMLARTELIRAHHLATMNTYREWGVLGVKLVAEWSTAGDDRVCSSCGSLEGKIFTLDEIEPMIPLHPNCRCIALPKIVDK